MNVFEQLDATMGGAPQAPTASNPFLQLDAATRGVTAPQYVEPPNLWERFGAGTNDIWHGAKQLYYDVTGNTAARKAEDATYGTDTQFYTTGIENMRSKALADPAVAFAAQHGAVPGLTADAPRTLGQLAATAPAIAIPGGPAVQGGVLGLLQPVGADQGWPTRIKNTAIGFSVGGILGKVASNLPALSQEAQPSLTPEMLARQSDIEAVGAQPTLAQVTRNPADWTAATELGKKAGPTQAAFTGRMAQNNQAMQDYLTGIKSGPGGTSYEAAEAVSKAVKDWAAGSQKDVSQLYAIARGSAGANASVPMQPIADQLGKVAEDFGPENIGSAVTNRLQQYGLLGGTQTRLLTVQDAEGLRRFIGNNINWQNPAQAKALASIQNSIDEATGGLGGQFGGETATAFQAARAAARQRFAQMEPALVGRTLNATEMSPEFVRNTLMTGKPGDITQLRNIVAQQSPDAWASAHDSVIDTLLQRSTKQTGFSGDAFGKALDAMGPERLQAIFSPQEVAQLETLRRASQAMTTVPQGASVNVSNTASALGNMLQKMKLGPILGTAAGAAAEHAFGSMLPVPGAGMLGGYLIGQAGEHLGERLAARQMNRMLSPVPGWQIPELGMWARANPAAPLSALALRQNQ